MSDVQAGLLPAETEADLTAATPTREVADNASNTQDRSVPGSEEESDYYSLLAEALKPASSPAPEVLEPSPTEEPPAAPAPEAKAEDDGEEPEESAEEIKARQRITAHDDVNALALTLYRKAAKSGSPIDLDVATARARAALGVEVQAPAQGEPTQQQAEPIADLAEIDAQLAQIEADRKRLAGEEFDAEALDALIDRRDALKEQRAQVIEARKAQEAQVAQEFQGRVDESIRSLVDVYPGFAVEGSPEWNAMGEMYAKLQKLDDPELKTANHPLYVGRLVAKALGLVPGVSTPAPTQAPAVPPGKAPASSARPAAASSSLPGRGPQPQSGSASSASPSSSLDALLANPDLSYDDIVRAVTRR